MFEIWKNNKIKKMAFVIIHKSSFLIKKLIKKIII